MKWGRRVSFLAFCLLVAGIWGLIEAAGDSSNVTFSVTTREPILTLMQSNYRWYENINSLTPTTALANENSTTTTPDAGTVVRLRMNILDSELALAAGATFNLQYASATSGPWTALSTSTAWIFADNSGVADGYTVTDLKLSNSNVAESYSESNPTAATPNAINPGEHGEWDWVIRNNSADTESGWFFRMLYSSSTELDGYTRYPHLAAQAPAAPEVPSTPPSPAYTGGGGTGFYKPPFPTGTGALPPGLAIPPPFLPPGLQKADFNGDGRVDIVDLSILLYHYEQRGSAIARYDLNRSLAVDFPDVSILMFYWTG